VWQLATELNSVVTPYQAAVHEIKVIKVTLRLSKEILEFLGLSLIKYATFIVPNFVVCCLLRARSGIENRIVGPGLLLNFPLLRQFNICALLQGFGGQLS